MNSIENGATIRIGLKECDIFDSENERTLNFSIPAYSLKIDKKTIFHSEGGGTEKNYIPSCIENAKKIGSIMKEKGIKNYIIYNGEMIGSATKKWESCGYIPQGGEEIFKETLEESLNN